LINVFRSRIYKSWHSISDREDSHVLLECPKWFHIEYDVFGFNIDPLISGVVTRGRLDLDLPNLNGVLNLWCRFRLVLISFLAWLFRVVAERILVSAGCLTSFLLESSGHLLDMKSCELWVLGHEGLQSWVDLFSCLNDHVVDVHVSPDTIWFELRVVSW